MAIRGKTIFITGGAGFIANCRIRNLIKENQIIVYDNFHRDTLTNSEVANHVNLKIVKGDVLGQDLLIQSMQRTDIVPKDIPIANANRDNITEKLEMLIKDAPLRNQIGKQGCAYIDKYHSEKYLAGEMIKNYEQVIKEYKSQSKK